MNAHSTIKRSPPRIPAQRGSLAALAKSPTETPIGALALAYDTAYGCAVRVQQIADETRCGLLHAPRFGDSTGEALRVILCHEPRTEQDAAIIAMSASIVLEAFELGNLTKRQEQDLNAVELAIGNLLTFLTMNYGGALFDAFPAVLGADFARAIGAEGADANEEVA